MVFYIISIILSLIVLLTNIMAMFFDVGARFDRYFGEVQTCIFLGLSIMLIIFGFIKEGREIDALYKDNR